jgi:nucleotide-binding universal stress UspA family protein
MFSQILLPVDGSEHSERAVPLAAELARGFEGEVIVYHVRERSAPHPLPYAVEAYVVDEDPSVADRVAKQLKDEGVSARAEERSAFYGQVPRLIAETADREGCDIIVMGYRGRSDLGGLVVGSVTHKVMHLAHCPVLVAR